MAWTSPRRFDLVSVSHAPRLHVRLSRRLVTRPSALRDVRGELLANVYKPILHTAMSLVFLLSSAAPVMADIATSARVDAQYEQVVRRKMGPRAASSSSPAITAMGSRDLFTQDAWEGMIRLQEYTAYVNQRYHAEEQPGCEQCTANRTILEKAWQVVATEFYDPVGRFSQAAWADQLLATLKEAGGVLPSKSALYAAAERMVSHLGDRYSTFLPPSQFRQALRRPLPSERSYLAAQFVGVGLQLGAVVPGAGRLVEAPLAGSPAEGAGVLRGDRVLEIDGMPAEALTMDETTALLRGPAGSSVSVLLAPAARPDNLRRLQLERRALPQPALKEARLATPGGGSVAYLRLHYFSSETTRAVRAAVERGEEDLVGGYILDLRNNPGGTFEEAIAIAALFLDPNVDITETVNTSGNLLDNVFKVGSLPQEIFPDQPGPLTNRPVLLLVNRSSASASEVLAGALHDNHRAELIGERTFGKGVLQYYYPMSDGSGLKLTVAKYLTPARHDISRQGGLRPDIPCSDYPHGVFSPGTADRCVLQALDSIETQLQTRGPLPYTPLYASTGRSTSNN